MLFAPNPFLPHLPASFSFAFQLSCRFCSSDLNFLPLMAFVESLVWKVPEAIARGAESIMVTRKSQSGEFPINRPPFCGLSLSSEPVWHSAKDLQPTCQGTILISDWVPTQICDQSSKYLRHKLPTTIVQVA